MYETEMLIDVTGCEPKTVTATEYFSLLTPPPINVIATEHYS